MVVFRSIVIFLLLASALCFGFYVGTGRQHFKRLGLVILKWTLVAAFVFFAILIAERML